MKKEKLIINEVIDSGLIVEDPNEKDYHSKLFEKSDTPMFGAISPLEKAPIIFPNGKGWHQIATSYGNPEIQLNKNFDTYCCVLFGIAKATCYYLFKRYGVKTSVSEMYNAFYARVEHGRGTSIRLGMESFRKYGWVEDRNYPFTAEMVLKDFYKRPPKEIQIMARGKLKKWKFRWEVIPVNLDSIKNQYKRTPVVLTGFAWASRNGIYYDNGRWANHCFLGLEVLDNGNNFCDDTYPKTFKYKENVQKDELFKELHKSFKYASAHACWLEPIEEKKKLLTYFINMFKKISRDTKGGFWFIKDGKKQKIEDWEAMLGSIIDEIGVEKNNLTDDDLAKLPDHKFFGK